MAEKFYFLDSYKVSDITCIREDYPTLYCNSKDTLNKMVAIAKSQGRKGIVTGEASFNAHGVLVKNKK